MYRTRRHADTLIGHATADGKRPWVLLGTPRPPLRILDGLSQDNRWCKQKILAKKNLDCHSQQFAAERKTQRTNALANVRVCHSLVKTITTQFHMMQRRRYLPPAALNWQLQLKEHQNHAKSMSVLDSVVLTFTACITELN